MLQVQGDEPQGHRDRDPQVLDMQVPPMKRIAVDWDSTCVEEVWPGMGDWLPGAVDALKELAAIYDEVVIFTLRVAPVDVDEVTPHDPINQILAINYRLAKAGIPDNVYVWTKPYKPPAEFWVDDRAIRFSGDWTEILDRVTLYGRYTLTNTLWPKEENMEGRDDNPWRTQDGIKEDECVRTFETGAIRDTDDGKLDYEGFLSPLVLRRYAEYMHEHRIQSNGELRPSDNWQKGIPADEYMKSAFRHFMDWWTAHRDENMDAEFLEEAVCALMFNCMGYLREFMLE